MKKKVRANEMVLILTRNQAAFLERLLEGTEGATDDSSVAQDCRRLRKRLNDAFERSR